MGRERVDEDKLAELILYVANRTLEDPAGGATKINKLIFFAEFARLRAYRQPITGAQYQKRPNGPAPRRVLPVRARLLECGDAELRQDEYFGYPIHRPVPLREPDVSVFSDIERRTIARIISAFWGKTARELSELSHQEPGWKLVADGADIPYPTAFLAKQADGGLGEDRRSG
jgi:hypothetical protein